ncbi:hypothetical protein RIF29_07904 [Crotalaria pallida]|uniref:Mitochondrial import receptor subunit TOM5 homolog n=1 Tax=Crotalaria pallida TaxID=3830 RepID=A0AAN9J4T9_CROPI
MGLMTGRSKTTSVISASRRGSVFGCQLGIPLVYRKKKKKKIGVIIAIGTRARAKQQPSLVLLFQLQNPNSNSKQFGDPSSLSLSLSLFLFPIPLPPSHSHQSMANSAISLQNLKDFVTSQIHDEEKWAFNAKLLRALGLFAGSIVLMRNYGDLMAI